jgi:hypothetical protein
MIGENAEVKTRHFALEFPFANFESANKLKRMLADQSKWVTNGN